MFTRLILLAMGLSECWGWDLGKELPWAVGYVTIWYCPVVGEMRVKENLKHMGRSGQWYFTCWTSPRSVLPMSCQPRSSQHLRLLFAVCIMVFRCLLAGFMFEGVIIDILEKGLVCKHSQVGMLRLGVNWEFFLYFYSRACQGVGGLEDLGSSSQG